MVSLIFYMRKVTTKWTCKDGTRVRICDMSDTHLLNTIRMLRRTHAELVSAWDQIPDDDFGAHKGAPDQHPLYGPLTQEAQRRKLKL